MQIKKCILFQFEQFHFKIKYLRLDNTIRKTKPPLVINLALQVCVFNTFEGVSLESDEHTEFPCLLFFSFIQVDMFTLPDFLLGVVVTNQYPVTSDMCPAKSFSINLEAAVAVTWCVKLYKMLIL